MKSAPVAKLKSDLSKYLARVKAGEEVLVTDRGIPVAKLVPVEPRRQDVSSHLHDLEKAGLAVIGTGKVPSGFWQWKRPADPEGRAVKALIEERSNR